MSKSITCLLLVALLTSANALRTGDDAATPQIKKWLLNGPVNFSFDRNGPDADKKLFALKIWGTWSPACARAVPLLAHLQEKYREQGLRVIAVSRDAEEEIQHFINAHPEINYAVGMDDQNLTTLRYLGDSRMLPRVYLIDINNKIIWDGEPVDLPAILNRFYVGGFDARKQLKISKLCEELEIFVRRNDLKSVEAASDKIFAIDPTNGPAFRMRLFMYEAAASPDVALNFLNDRLRQTPDVPGIYFAKLDFAARYQKYRGEALAVATKFVERFSNDAEQLNEMAWALLTGFAFLPGILPTAARCVTRSLEITPDHDSASYASLLNTQALLFYRVGAPEQALQIQQRVSAMIKDKSVLETSRQAEQIYREAIELRGKLHLSTLDAAKQP